MSNKNSFEALGFFLVISLMVHFYSLWSPNEPPKENSGSARFVADCPTGSRRTGQNCTVETTIVLNSNELLDCEGNTLVPVKTGTDGSHSTPEVAVFLNKVRNTRIINCVIEGFDFGVFAINSRFPTTSVQIRNNTIRSRFSAVSLMAVDRAQISHNNLEFTVRKGRALYIGRNSNRNEITSNTITADLISDNVTVFRAPGPSGSSNTPVGNQPSAVVIAQIEPPEHALINIVIESLENKVVTKRVHQVPVFDSGPSGFSKENVFASNTITFSGSPTDGISVALSHTTTLTRNVITGAKNSIRVAVDYKEKLFPGRCKLNRNRYCLEHADCNIPNVDKMKLGPCVNSRAKTVSWSSRGTKIVRNDLVKPTDGGILVAGEGTHLIRNSITGRSSGPQSTDAGIVLAGSLALQNATVIQRNTISKFSRGLQLVKSPDFGNGRLRASVFAAQISLNDFTNHRTAVVTDNGYNIRTEVSSSGRGNYWGKCPALEKSDVKNEDGNTLPGLFVKDSHAFKSLVAQQSRLPAHCP